MANQHLTTMMRHLHTVRGGARSEVPDAELLERYVVRRDEAAFELLVCRHEWMVRSVCRRVLRQEQDAQDAFQATFLILACKANSIGKRQALAGWLYKVAYRVALRGKAEAAKRGYRERPCGGGWPEAVAGSDPCDEADRLDSCRALDDEIHRLPEKYRTPVVLCYLEGRTNEEVARQLRCPVGTVVTRLARARQRLRTRLVRRGLGLSAGLFTAALVHLGEASAAPLAFRRATVAAALRYATRPVAGGPVSVEVAALTKGTLTAMMTSKLKLAAAVVLAVGLLGLGASFSAVRATPNPAPRQSKDERPAAPERAEAPAPEDPPAKKEDKPRPADKKDEKPKEPVKFIPAREVITQSFKTGKAPKLVVEVFSGSIEITADAKDTIDARVTKQATAMTPETTKDALKNVEVKMAQDGDTVRITARKLDEKAMTGHAGASASVHVPAGAVLDLRTSNGGVTVTGGTGNVTLATTNGGVQVKGNTGSLNLTASNGPIAVIGAKGRIVLKTSNGPVEVQAEAATVTVETSNGPIHFDGSLTDGQHTFETSNGPIDVILPRDTNFKAEAATSNGRVTTGFSDPALKRKDGPGLVVLKLRTSNGNISVRPPKAK